MTARMRRLASDWEQVKKDFTGHQNIVVTPIGEEPPEKYHVTYFVNGIYMPTFRDTSPFVKYSLLSGIRILEMDRFVSVIFGALANLLAILSST